MGKMNTYKAFYRNRNIEVKALTTYKAQTEAAKILKAKKQHEVTVMLLELAGQPYTHRTSDL